MAEGKSPESGNKTLDCVFNTENNLSLDFAQRIILSGLLLANELGL